MRQTIKESTAEKFFESLAAEALELILEAPLIHQFQHLNDNQLRLFVKQFYFFARFFPRILGALIWRSPDNFIQSSIIENLIDEVGGLSKFNQIDINKSHRKIFINFAEELGLTETDLENGGMRPYTYEMLNKMENVFVHSPFIEAMGGISPGMENIGYHWVGALYKGLQKQNRFTEKSLYYFALHASVDEKHGYQLKQALLPYLNDTSNQKLLRRGALTIAMAQRQLLEGLQKDFETLGIF